MGLFDRHQQALDARLLEAMTRAYSESYESFTKLPTSLNDLQAPVRDAARAELAIRANREIEAFANAYLNGDPSKALSTFRKNTSWASQATTFGETLSDVALTPSGVVRLG